MARTVTITAHPNAANGRFCRCGRCFGTVGTPQPEADYTPEQLAAFEAEPMLVVEYAEAPENKKPAKAEATKPAEAPAAGTEPDATSAKPDTQAAKPEAVKPEAKPTAKKEGGK